MFGIKLNWLKPKVGAKTPPPQATPAPPPEAPRMEDKVFNPLRLRIGTNSVIRLDELDLRKLEFSLSEITEHLVSVAGRKQRFTDYLLVADGPKDNPWTWDGVVEARLRIVERERPTPGKEFLAIVLFKEDEWDWDKAVVDDIVKNGRFAQELDERTGLAEWRCTDKVRTPFVAARRNLFDHDHNGTISEGEVTMSKIEYYVLDREAQRVPGEKSSPTFRELCVIEVRQDGEHKGFTQLWRGWEISMDSIQT